MPTKRKSAPATPVDTALEWVDGIRRVDDYSLQEKKLIALADEVKRLRRDTRGTQGGALRPVPTPADPDAMAQIAMEQIDAMGAPPLPREAWIELLEEIISQCRTRIAAAREDASREQG